MIQFIKRGQVFIFVCLFSLIYMGSVCGQVEWRRYEVMIPVGKEKYVDITPRADTVVVLYFWKSSTEAIADSAGRPSTKMKILADKFQQREWEGLIRIVTATEDESPRAHEYFEEYFGGKSPFPVLSINERDFLTMRGRAMPRAIMKAPLKSEEEVRLSQAPDLKTFNMMLNGKLERVMLEFFRIQRSEHSPEERYTHLTRLKIRLDKLQEIFTINKSDLAYEYVKLGDDFIKIGDDRLKAEECYKEAHKLDPRIEGLPFISKITVKPSSVTLRKGQSQNFTAQAFGPYGKEIPDLSFEWRLKDAIFGIISEDGNFKATRIGKDTVIASYQGEKGRASVIVVDEKNKWWLGFSSITLATGALGSGTSALLFKKKADRKFQKIPPVPSEERVVSWGDYTKFQTRSTWYGWTSANLGISTLPFLLDWMDKGPRIDKWWMAGFFFAGSATFGIFALISKNDADDIYNKIPTQLSEDRVNCWGEYNKLNERANILAANAIIDFVTAIGILFWYDCKDETVTSSGYLNRHPSLSASIHIGKDWTSNRQILFVIKKSF